MASTSIRTIVHLDLREDADWDEAEARTVAALTTAGEPTEVLSAMVRTTMIIDQ